MNRLPLFPGRHRVDGLRTSHWIHLVSPEQAVETIQATIEGIGTLRHTVVAEDGVPDDLSGAQLPPTNRRGN